MRLLIASAIFIATLLGLSGLITLYDRRLLLYEYDRRIRPCPGCGRGSLGVRRRRTRADTWGPWCSACCGVPLDARENLAARNSADDGSATTGGRSSIRPPCRKAAAGNAGRPGS